MLLQIYLPVILVFQAESRVIPNAESICSAYSRQFKLLLPILLWQVGKEYACLQAMKGQEMLDLWTKHLIQSLLAKQQQPEAHNHRD